MHWDCATENSLRYTAAYTVNSASPAAPGVYTILEYEMGTRATGTFENFDDTGDWMQVIAFDPGINAAVPLSMALADDFTLNALLVGTENSFVATWHVSSPDGVSSWTPSGGASIVGGASPITDSEIYDAAELDSGFDAYLIQATPADDEFTFGVGTWTVTLTITGWGDYDDSTSVVEYSFLIGETAETTT